MNLFGIDFYYDYGYFRGSITPSVDANGHQRSVYIPLPFGKALQLYAYSWDHFDHAETDPLITGPIECARCGEEFESVSQRIMHVERKRCPDVDTQADVDALDSVHAMEDAFR